MKRNPALTNVVVDSSVILAHLKNEPGSDAVSALFGTVLISAVNMAEIIGKLREWGVALTAIKSGLSRYGLDVVPFDEVLAETAGLLRPITKELGLSIGDRACLALGQHYGVPVLTMDRAWSKLALPMEVRVLR